MHFIIYCWCENIVYLYTDMSIYTNPMDQQTIRAMLIIRYKGDTYVFYTVPKPLTDVTRTYYAITLFNFSLT